VGFAHAKCFLYNTSAQWFGPDVTCKPIRCGEPEDIMNGILERKCQTFGCRISYACEPGYQLLGRTHRSKPCFSLSSLSYVCYFFSPQMCQPSVPLFFVKFQRWKIPKSRALVASAFKKGFPTLICQIVRQTRLEIFPKLPNSPGIYGHGGNLFMILIPLFTINHLSSPPPPSSSSPTSG